MNEILTRAFHQLMERGAGPFRLRILLQPLTAVLLAVRAGLKDAHSNRAAFLWSLFFHPSERWDLIKSGWNDVAKVFIIAVVIDVVYQLIMFRWFYPLQTLIVAILLAIVPYVVMRGPVTRLVRTLDLRRKDRTHIDPRQG